jgi:protein-S-isoprenylcysteine O-methyltransferase Ste14
MKKRPVLPPTYLLIALLVMLAVHFLLPAREILGLPWRLFGLLPLVFGVGINLAADRALHRAGTTVKPFEEPQALVAGGAYRFSRHPMYLGFAAILTGVAVLLGSLWPWAVIPPFIFVMDRAFIRPEESMLERRFGAAWDEYKLRVRRWF